MNRRVPIVALTVSALFAGYATSAQNASDVQLSALAPGARIDAARERLRDDALSGSERLAALRDLIDALEARSALADLPSETRARDAVELAEALLTASAWEGVQATASVGILTPGMRSTAAAQAQSTLDALDKYAAAVEGARESNETLALRARLARSRAGMMLHQSSTDEASKRIGLEAAQSIRGAPTLLRSREDMIEGAAAVENAEAEAQRLILLGLVALDDGNASEARSKFESAATVALSPRSQAEATLGAALATRGIEGPAAAIARLSALELDPAFVKVEESDPLVRILRADAMRRVAIGSSEFAQGEAFIRAVNDAGAPYLALAARGVAGIEPIALRGLLLQKAAASGAPLVARLGPDQREGAFERLAVAMSPPTAVKLSLIMRADGAIPALGDFAADGLWALGGTLREKRDDRDAQYDAVTIALAMAERFPGDLRVGAALGAGAASAQRYAALTNESPEAMGMYEAVLRAAIAHVERQDDPALREDSLRFELGRVLAIKKDDESSAEQLAKVTEGELGLRASELLLSLAQRSGDESRIARAAGVVEDRARAVLALGENPVAQAALERAGAVGQNAELRGAIERSDASAAEAAAMLLASSEAPGVDRVLRGEAIEIVEGLSVIERERGDLNESQRASARVAVAIAGALVGLSERTKAAALDGDRVLLARAQRMTADPALARESAATLETVLARAGRSPELLAELAEALHASDQDERAFPVYRELSNATRADNPRTRSMYWLAWGRMLTILADNNADGSRTATIRAQTERLRLIDPALGGEPHKGRIEAAAKSASR
jgi:ElaB/YqjD/DUF883 family membrane-anchored ribosome-binding protein